MTQLELFDDGTPKIEVGLSKTPGGWLAIVNQGWYIAHGVTERAALIAVAKRIESETGSKIDVPNNV